MFLDGFYKASTVFHQVLQGRYKALKGFYKDLFLEGLHEDFRGLLQGFLQGFTRPLQVFTRLFHGIKKLMVSEGFYQAFARFLQGSCKASAMFYKVFFTFSEGVWRAFEIRLLGMHKLPQSF